MKLLRVTASHFKNACDHFSIDLVAKSRKTAEGKEYELQEIADGLYTQNTMAIVGKNASGKTMAVDLLDCCYSILGDFSLENRHYNYDGIHLEITFYHEGYVYRYTTGLSSGSTLSSRACFVDQQLLRKKYRKSNVNSIYDDDSFKPVPNIRELPEDTSIVFFVLKKKETRAMYFGCDGEGVDTYQRAFKALKQYGITTETLSSILEIFDPNIAGLEMVDDHNYRLTYRHDARQQLVSDKELVYLLSSGTTKGLLLYTLMAASLRNGFDLLIDEVENHFHKTLVENMLSLYKDKAVNRHNASLIFTTHYCEVLDLFSRQDSIWISTAGEQVSLRNMYEDFNVRSELLKSRQFYSNAFQTAVNYEDLMRLKKELMKP